MGYRLSGQSVKLLEILPSAMIQPRNRAPAICEATYGQTQDCWKIFWIRASLKWEGTSRTLPLV